MADVNIEGSDDPIKDIEDAIKSLEAEDESLKDDPTPDEDADQTQDSDDTESEPNPIEEEARKKGWKPGGPKSAEEFLRAEPLYEEIKSRGKEIKELKHTLDELKAHMLKQKAAEEDRVRAAVEQARKEAIELGDVEGVDEADRQLKELDPQATQRDPAVDEFLANNSDWADDPSYKAQKIRDFAYQREQQLSTGPKQLSVKEMMDIIHSDIREEFVDYFKSDPTPVAPPKTVESDQGRTGTTRSGKVKTFSDLNSEQKTCARYFERHGIMKIDEYIKQLQDAKEL